MWAAERGYSMMGLVERDRYWMEVVVREDHFEAVVVVSVDRWSEDFERECHC